MFDSISYGKASDVLLTVENYLGAETFRKGVHAYLLAHLYGNATAEDFWNAQTATSHKPMDKIMEISGGPARRADAYLWRARGRKGFSETEALLPERQH